MSDSLIQIAPDYLSDPEEEADVEEPVMAPKSLASGESEDEILAEISMDAIKPAWGLAEYQVTYGDDVQTKQIKVKGVDFFRVQQALKVNEKKIAVASRDSLGYRPTTNQVFAALSVTMGMVTPIRSREGEIVFGEGAMKEDLVEACVVIMNFFDFNQLDSIMAGIRRLTKKDQANFFDGAS